MRIDFQDGQKYDTLYEVLEREKEWAVRQLVAGGPHADQEELLVRLFQDCCRYQDDDTALRCFGWILKAIENWLLHHHGLLKEGMIRRQGPFWFFRRPNTDEGQEQLQRVSGQLARSPARLALKLWPDLPVKGKGSCRMQVAEDESYWQDCDAPTMLKTKKALLEAIAERWRVTKDEAEADALFAEILSRADASQFKEERKLVETVVREATGAGFPPIRAIRHHLLLAEELARRDRFGCGLKHQIAKTLAIAWARNCQLEDQVQVFRTVQPLLKERRDTSFPEFVLMRQTAEQLAELEGKLASLRKRLNPNRVFSSHQVRFRFLSTTAVLVTEICQAGYGQLDEDNLHDRFVELREAVQSWRQEHSTVSVTVRLEVPSTLKDGEPLFEREQTLDRSVG